MEKLVEIAMQLELACTDVDCWDLECDGEHHDYEDDAACQSCVDGNYCEHCRF